MTVTFLAILFAAVAAIAICIIIVWLAATRFLEQTLAVEEEPQRQGRGWAADEETIEFRRPIAFGRAAQQMLEHEADETRRFYARRLDMRERVEFTATACEQQERAGWRRIALLAGSRKVR